MHTFEILGQPIRRRIVEMLASGEHLSGDVEAIVIHEFGVGRSAVQHHLALLRLHNWVIVREEDNMRGYRLNAAVLRQLESEIARLRRRYRHRIGWIEGTAQLVPVPSKRGRRGHGLDPDDPWRRYRKPKPEPRLMN